jgi:hypothetical protein
LTRLIAVTAVVSVASIDASCDGLSFGVERRETQLSEWKGERRKDEALLSPEFDGDDEREKTSDDGEQTPSLYLGAI